MIFDFLLVFNEQPNIMPFILPNGDVCDDEEIYGPFDEVTIDDDAIDDYDDFEDFEEEAIERWEFRLLNVC